MGRHDVVNLLREGLSPTDIISKLNRNRNTVFQYLFWGVGIGLIKRSDVFFSYDHKTRNIIESIIKKTNSINPYNILKEAQEENLNLSRETVEGYLNFRDARFVWGDMYEYIRDIELLLHKFVKETLVLEYGEQHWWRKGIPEKVRVECVTLLEKDVDPASESYCYTNFIHLGKIIENQWNIFKQKFPKQMSSDRKQLLARFIRLNSIRNSVMHPIKEIQLTEQEFEFVREFRNDLNDISFV